MFEDYKDGFAIGVIKSTPFYTENFLTRWAAARLQKQIEEQASVMAKRLASDFFDHHCYTSNCRITVIGKITENNTLRIEGVAESGLSFQGLMLTAGSALSRFKPIHLEFHR